MTMKLRYDPQSKNDYHAVFWELTDINQNVHYRYPVVSSDKYPIPGTATYDEIPFMIAGKKYSCINELCGKLLQEKSNSNECGIPDIDASYRCKYGRIVIYIKEHFPCYDRYDRLYDKRFSHYYYVFDGEQLSLLLYADTSDSVYVYEDVSKIYWLHLRRMKGLSVFHYLFSE